MIRRVGSYPVHGRWKRLAVPRNSIVTIFELWVFVSCKIQIHGTHMNVLPPSTFSLFRAGSLTQMGDFMLKLQLTESLRPEEVDAIGEALAKVKKTWGFKS